MPPPVRLVLRKKPRNRKLEPTQGLGMGKQQIPNSGMLFPQDPGTEAFEAAFADEIEALPECAGAGAEDRRIKLSGPPPRAPALRFRTSPTWNNAILFGKRTHIP
jgi:hypothetical protein